MHPCAPAARHSRSSVSMPSCGGRGQTSGRMAFDCLVATESFSELVGALVWLNPRPPPTRTCAATSARTIVLLPVVSVNRHAWRSQSSRRHHLGGMSNNTFASPARMPSTRLFHAPLLPSLRLPFNLANRPNLLAVIKNSSWLLFDKLMRMLLGLLVGAWVARYLGPAQYGELAYALAYIAFFQAVANLGMDGIVVRDIARDQSQAGQILGTAFALRLATGVLCWLVAVLGMAWSNGWQDRSVAIVALVGASLIFQSADTIDLWFQSQSQSKRTVLAKLVAYLLANGVKVLLILSQAPLLAFAAVAALEFATAGLALAYAYRRFPCQSHWQKVVIQHWFDLLKKTSPLMFSGVWVTIYSRVDQIMIKHFLSEYHLGLYTTVLPLSQAWNFLPTILMLGLLPYLAADSLANRTHKFVQLLQLSAIFAILISIAMAIISKPLVALLLGEAYKESATILSVIVFSNIFTFLGSIQSVWATTENRLRVYFISTLISSSLSIVVTAILISYFGLVGAALAYLISMFLAVTLIPVIIDKKLRNIYLMAFGVSDDSK